MSQFGGGAAGLLEPLNPWLSDESVAEILINRPQEVWVESAGKGMQRFEVPTLTASHLTYLSRLIANENHQRLSEKTPLLSGSLPQGERVQICLPPTAGHTTFSIRRKVVRHFTLDDYQRTAFYKAATPATLTMNHALDLSDDEQALLTCYQHHDWNQFIRRAIDLKKTIVVSGATGSGKTTFLNACLHHIPHSERIITLEDTREIECPHPNQVNLLAVKGEQGVSGITTQDLVPCCLRLRPDRIIMGEIRDKEIMDFVNACSTGHEGSITSIHATNPAIAFQRMVQLYKFNNVPSMRDDEILAIIKSVVDIILQVTRLRSGAHQLQSVYYAYGHLAT